MDTPNRLTSDSTPGAAADSTRQPSGRRRGLAIGGLAGIVAGGLAGLAMTLPSFTDAASDTATTVAVADDGAADDGTAEHTAEHTARLREVLQALVDDGTISAEQADAVAAHLAANAPRPGGPDGRHGPDVDVDIDIEGGRLDGRRGPHGPGPEVVAGALGIDVADLADRVRSGETIAEIARSEGLDVQTVIDTLVTEVQQHLDDEVAEGDITEDEAAERLARATEMVTDLVNGDLAPRR